MRESGLESPAWQAGIRLTVRLTLSCTCSPQALYLDPLLQRVRSNGGLVYPQSRYLGVCTVVTLMVDVKDTPQQSAERSFDIIHSILQAYAGD